MVLIMVLYRLLNRKLRPTIANGTSSFTLIELLIVIVIIGILTSVAIPQYQKMLTKSKLAGMWICLSDLRKAVQVYRMEHGSGPPVSLGGNNWEQINSTKLNDLGMTLDLPFYKYQIWWTTIPNDAGFGRLNDVNVSANNMAFIIGFLQAGALPGAIMTEAGLKKYCISGNINNSADWSPAS